MDTTPVLRIPMDTYHKLIQGGKALLVFQNAVVGIADALEPTFQFKRGSSDADIVQAFLDTEKGDTK